jgi:D-aminopeptidase
MTALGFKAGIGTSSRRVPLAGLEVTLGVLVQANFGGTLRVGGRTVTPADVGVLTEDSGSGPETGSCMIVVATDAPLDARQLTRLARRAVYALARVAPATGTAAATTASPSAPVRWARPPDPRWCPMPGSTPSSAPCWTPWKRRSSTHC